MSIQENVSPYIKELNAKIQADSVSDKHVLLHAMTFVQEIQGNRQLTIIVNAYSADAMNDRSQLEAMKVSLELELDSIFEKLLIHIQQHNLEDAISANYKQFGYKTIKAKTVSSHPLYPLHEKTLFLEAELKALISVEPIDSQYLFISTVASITCLLNREIDVSLHLRAQFESYCIENDRIDQLQRLMPGYHWEYLVWVYAVYKDAQNLHSEKWKSGDLLDSWAVSAAHNQIKSILAEKNSESTVLRPVKIDEIKFGISIIARDIEKNLLHPKPNTLPSAYTQSCNEEDTVEYDSSTGVVKIILQKQPYDIDFQKSGMRYYVLLACFPGGRPIKSGVSYGDIYDSYIRTEADPYWEQLTKEEQQERNDKINEAFRGINGRAKAKTSQRIQIIRLDNLTLFGGVFVLEE